MATLPKIYEFDVLGGGGTYGVVSSPYRCIEGCEHCKVDGLVQPKKIEIELFNWDDTPNFIWTDSSDLILIKDFVYRKLRGYEPSGINFKKVQISDIQGEGAKKDFSHKVYQIDITRTAEPPKDLLEEFNKGGCKFCGSQKYFPYGKIAIVNPDSWDGSDFFRLKGYIYRYILTEKALNVLNELGIKNIETKDAYFGELAK